MEPAQTPHLALAGDSPLFIGVVHLKPCPGAPRYAGDLGLVLDAAQADAEALAEGGAHAIIVENFGDTPFFAASVPPETVAAMALAVERVRAAARGLPIGVNVLRNDARAALGLCASSSANFLRINVHTGAMLTDQGLLQGQAAQTLRVRRELAPSALILADVHVKHATPLGQESLLEAAQDAFERGHADALVISGPRTGSAPDPAQLRSLSAALPSCPLLIGSGLDLDNAAQLLPHVGGAIVGTALKAGGQVAEAIQTSRVRELAMLFCG